MTKLNRHALYAALFMALVAVATYALKPTKKIVDTLGRLELETTVPKSFDGWTIDPQSMVAVVNPQQQAFINEIYSQTLTRTYVNPAGYRIMLTIAYGEDQRDNAEVHKPEICYPAQGFALQGIVRGTLNTTNGDIPVKRLVTTLGPRTEPITYWTTLGQDAVKDGIDKKMLELRYGLRGYIVDGLLFRISSIDANETNAYSIHQQFASALLAATRPEIRRRLSGLN